MRADAARNLDTVLRTGARLLAEDPGTSISAIAAAAGVDRRTVYRRFASREALLDAVFHTKLDAVEQVFVEARLDCAPVAVALHRLAEGFIAVTRHYPVDAERMSCDTESWTRVLGLRERLARFLHRAAEEGAVRADLPDGLAAALVHDTLRLVAHRMPELDPPAAADLAVEILLSGIGCP